MKCHTFQFNMYIQHVHPMNETAQPCPENPRQIYQATRSCISENKDRHLAEKLQHVLVLYVVQLLRLHTKAYSRHIVIEIIEIH